MKNQTAFIGLKKSSSVGLMAIGLIILTMALKVGIEGVLKVDMGQWLNIPLALESATLLGASFASSREKSRKK